MFAKGGFVDQFKKGKTEELNLERDFLIRRSGLLLSTNVEIVEKQE